MRAVRATRPSTLVLLTILAAGAAGCGMGREAQEGSGLARVALSAATLSPNVAEVIVTITPGDGPDFPPITAGLTKNADGWSAFITNIPAGPNRLFQVVANDATVLVDHAI